MRASLPRLAVLLAPALVVATGPVRGADDPGAVAALVEADPAGGEVHWLEAGADRFLALYLEERTGAAAGGVLLVHGLGRHPDWPGPIAALRRRLPDAGWHTLSVHLPAPRVEAEPSEQRDLVDGAVDRIAAAYGFLVQRGVLNNVIVAHRWGVGPVALFLERGVPDAVSALVEIAPAYPAPGPGRERVEALVESLERPVLELVRAGEPMPPRAARAPDAALRTRRAVHAFEPDLADATDEVFKRVRAWLKVHAAGKEVPPEP